MKRAKRRSLSWRTRYHSSLLDTNNLTSGEDFAKLSDTYVTFILGYGPKKQGLPHLSGKKNFLEDNSDFDDGTRFIFVNGTYRGSDPIGELMNDFNAEGAEQVNHPGLKARGLQKSG